MIRYLRSFFTAIMVAVAPVALHASDSYENRMKGGYRECEEMVSLDKIWGYLFDGKYMPPMSAFLLEDVYFADTAEFNGKTYYRLVSADRPEADGYYLRQDGKKVYLRLSGHIMNLLKENPPGEYHSYKDEYSEELKCWFESLKEGDDYLVYDFDAKPGDKIPAIAFGNASPKKYWDFMDLPLLMGTTLVYNTILESEEILVNGIWRTRQKYSNNAVPDNGEYGSTFYAVEGVGFMNGNLLFPESGIHKASVDSCQYKFNHVRTKNWTYLFEERDVTASVIEVRDNSELHESKTSEAIYDLMGRQIKEPAPGQVFIRNGRKFIGRRPLKY